MENNNLPLLFEKYLQFCVVIRNYAPTTVANYKSTFKMFFRETNCLSLDQINKATLEQWFFDGRLNKKWGPVTFRHHIKMFNKFFDWLKTQNLISTNFVSEIEKPRLEFKLPRTLSKDQAQLIMDCVCHMRYTYKFEKHRNSAIIGIMLLAGLRKGEVIKLKMGDVSMETKTIFINQGKGHKDRMVPINFKLHNLLSEYLKDRKRLNKDSIYFFNSVQSNLPIGIKCIDILISKLRKKTRIDFSAHTLRHGFARLMLEGGCDIYTLSKILGHNKITTTTIYLSCSNLQMAKSIEMHSLN